MISFVRGIGRKTLDITGPQTLEEMMQDAFNCGNEDQLKFCLDARADPNTIWEHNDQPLLFMAVYGSAFKLLPHDVLSRMAKLLLEYGASTRKTYRGNGPLDYAAHFGRHEFLSVMMKSRCPSRGCINFRAPIHAENDWMGYPLIVNLLAEEMKLESKQFKHSVLCRLFKEALQRETKDQVPNFEFRNLFL